MSSAEEWAISHFGTAQLGDPRLTSRAVRCATQIFFHPAASIPTQMGMWSQTKAMYRFLANSEVTHERLSQPEWSQTRHQAGQHRQVLFIHDTTTIDYSSHKAIEGLGEIGDGKGRGFFVQTALALIPDPLTIVGVAHQQIVVRQPATLTRAQRRTRGEVESTRWTTGVAEIGKPPPGVQWIHVADREGDMWKLFAECRQQNTDFVIRMKQRQRYVYDPAEPLEGVRIQVQDLVSLLPEVGTHQVQIPQRGNRPARIADVKVACGPVRMPPPADQKQKQEDLAVWMVRVWEEEPPSEETEPLEWILWTSCPTTTLEEALERTDWYALRWKVEEYHKCLKTGCGMEQKLLRTEQELEAFLGMIAPMAAYLLSLRYQAALTPDAPALQSNPAEIVAVVAWQSKKDSQTLTCQQFWHTLAKMGGWMGRKGDGPPGWQTLWRGWRRVQAILEGVQLVSSGFSL